MNVCDLSNRVSTRDSSPPITSRDLQIRSFQFVPAMQENDNPPSYIQSNSPFQNDNNAYISPMVATFPVPILNSLTAQTPTSSIANSETFPQAAPYPYVPKADLPYDPLQQYPQQPTYFQQQYQLPPGQYNQYYNNQQLPYPAQSGQYNQFSTIPQQPYSIDPEQKQQYPSYPPSPVPPVIITLAEHKTNLQAGFWPGCLAGCFCGEFNYEKKKYP
ncbi:hypothetical protein HK096_010535 [Nowakowskiella sp. JEL0078]|nr:hypothetical protein HK096_010535 [Nowakowskiella sp. JEL0078]